MVLMFAVFWEVLEPEAITNAEQGEASGDQDKNLKERSNIYQANIVKNATYTHTHTSEAKHIL